MIDIAISPCPNDTFLFNAWINGKINSPLIPKVTFADIQELNVMALNDSKSIIKTSCYCFGKNTDRYRLLPVGAAIGPFGPKLICKDFFSLDELKTKTVAIPGKDTTAYLLFKTLCPEPKQIVECSFEKIPSLVLSGKVDAGLIIHETRFTFSQMGGLELCDLGSLFYEKYSLPVPLGVVCARRDISDELVEQVCYLMKQSLLFAQNHPCDLGFTLSLSQEKNIDIVTKHIACYVNDETHAISETGITSIKTLFTVASEKGLLPKECVNFDNDMYVCNA